MAYDSNTIIKHHLSFLSETVHGAFENDAIANALAAIKELHGLADEQVRALQSEVSLTFLGLEFMSDFETRAKAALGVTDEKLEDVLEDLAYMLFTPEIMGELQEIEKIGREAEHGTPSNATPMPDTPPAKTIPENIPTVTTTPTPMVETRGHDAHLRETPPKEIPTGKMVGLKKETAESTIKGMRTMRGDINRLRGSENEDDGSDFTKPFKGT